MFEEHETHHPYANNIYGAEGCVTSNGEVCSACCTFFEVKPLKKAQHAPCFHQTCSGCSIHNHPEQPKICQDYHCSRETAILENPLITDQQVREVALERILGLLAVALEDQVISEPEYEEQSSYWESLLNRVYTIGFD